LGFYEEPFSGLNPESAVRLSFGATPAREPVRANSHSIWKEGLLLRSVRILQVDFNPVHVMAVSIGHGGYNSVIATSLPAKE
jgi:hypothetical protein